MRDEDSAKVYCKIKGNNVILPDEVKLEDGEYFQLDRGDYIQIFSYEMMEELGKFFKYHKPKPGEERIFSSLMRATLGRCQECVIKNNRFKLISAKKRSGELEVIDRGKYILLIREGINIETMPIWEIHFDDVVNNVES